MKGERPVRRRPFKRLYRCLARVDVAEILGVSQMARYKREPPRIRKTGARRACIKSQPQTLIQVKGTPKRNSRTLIQVKATAKQSFAECIISGAQLRVSVEGEEICSGATPKWESQTHISVEEPPGTAAATLAGVAQILGAGEKKYPGPPPNPNLSCLPF